MMNESTGEPKIVFTDEIGRFGEVYDSLVDLFKTKDVNPSHGVAVMSRLIADCFKQCASREKYFNFLETCKQLWPEGE